MIGKLYVAKDYNGYIVGIVIAENERSANAYWQGQGITPHTIRHRTMEIDDFHPSGVIPILKTREKKINSLTSNRAEVVMLKG